MAPPAHHPAAFATTAASARPRSRRSIHGLARAPTVWRVWWRVTA